MAYTYKGFYTIYTCLPFWARPAIGIDLQASTLVHELSYDVVGTDDIVYGTGQAMNLAKH